MLGARRDLALALSPPAGPDARERLEGMLVALAEPVTATESFTLARFGELVVSAGGRLFQPTNGGTADDAAEQAANEARSLVIDDRRGLRQRAVPAPSGSGRLAAADRSGLSSTTSSPRAAAAPSRRDRTPIRETGRAASTPIGWPRRRRSPGSPGRSTVRM